MSNCKFYKVLLINGIPQIDFDFVEEINNSEGECYVKLRSGCEVDPSCLEINEADWQALINRVQPQPGDSPPPDTITLLGQYIVQQTLKNAELEQKIDTVGAGVVQLMLKGSAV